MKDFKFNDGDWVLNEMVEGDLQLAQNLEHLFLTRIGEWFLDEGNGFNKKVLEQKKANERDITEAIYDTAYQDDRVEFVANIFFEKDMKNRTMQISFIAIKKDGGEVEVKTNVDI